jgi:hypothetical protein
MTQATSKRKVSIAAVAGCIGLAAWAGLAEAGLFSAKGPVIAIIAGELYLGEAEGHLSGAGTLEIHSQKNAGLTCLGKFTSSAELGGEGSMVCSDGASVAFSFQRLTVRRGHGTGSVRGKPMTFAYGMSAEEAAPYLELPAGKKLTGNGERVALVDY